MQMNFFSEAEQAALKKRKTWNDLREFLQNAKWFDDNFDKFEAKERGKIVIVYDKGIAFSSPDVQKVQEKITSLPAPNQAFVRHIAKAKTILLL
ncbi:MAG: hypothetical protein ACE5Q6_13475 [Dehalococcoidia bacterium]